MNDRIKNVSCGSYKVDLEAGGAIVSCDGNFSEMTGYTGEIIKERGMTFFDFVPPEDLDEYKASVAELQKRGGGAIEHRLVCADGSYLTVICIGVDFEEDGHKYSNISVSDITGGTIREDKYVRTQTEIELLSDTMQAGLAVYRLNPDGSAELANCNDEYYRIFRVDKDCDKNTIMKDSLCEEDMTKLYQTVRVCHFEKVKLDVVLQLKPEKGGSWISLTCRTSDVQEDGCEMIYYSVVDITETHEVEKELKKQSMRFQMIAENSEEIFFEYEVDTDTFTSTSHKLVEKYGTDTFSDYRKSKVAENHMPPEFRESYVRAMNEAVSKPTKGTFDYFTDAFDDDYYWYRIAYVSVADERDRVTNVFGMIYSIDNMKKMTSKIAEDKVEIERLLNSDHITGLLTRQAFNEKASEMLREHYPKGGCFAFIYSDINDFSYVNENFGYEAGDRMLRDFADFIRQTSGTLCACRIYSDFFVSLYHADSRDELIDLLSERNSLFSKTQKEKYPLSDIQISCGLYFVRSAEDEIPVAIDNANLARRSVKGSNDVPCGIYTDRMRKKRSHNQAIASQIWSAINSGAIELFLQPKFDLNTREIIGAEALTRWRNPDGSYKLPYEFIEVLENVGYITQVDLYIYEQVLKNLKKWKEEGKKLVPISVNFSRKHNNHPDFVDKVNALADYYGVDKSLIEIEVTESCFTQDVKNLFSNMRRLREQGFKIDIDDFGTGYSSLSVLIDAPVDIVKVDKVFIDNIESDEKSRAYINQICNLIQSTSKDIIFEGVETEEQAKILLGSGHTMAQGWLFDKAIPVEQFDDKYLRDVK